MENQQELTMNEETLFIKWLIDRVAHDFIKGRLVLEFSWANCHQILPKINLGDLRPTKIQRPFWGLPETWFLQILCWLHNPGTDSLSASKVKDYLFTQYQSPFIGIVFESLGIPRVKLNKWPGAFKSEHLKY